MTDHAFGCVLLRSFYVEQLPLTLKFVLTAYPGLESCSHPLGTPLNGLNPTETLYMRIGTFDWTSLQTKLYLISQAVSGTRKLCFNEANIAI